MQRERLGASQAHRVRAPALDAAADRDPRPADAARAAVRRAHQAEAADGAQGPRGVHRL